MPAPNIILLTVDHLRWNARAESAKTPYLDGVAKLGIEFDQTITSHQHPDRALDHLLSGVPCVRAAGITTAMIADDTLPLDRYSETFDTLREIPRNDDNPAETIHDIGTQCVRFLQANRGTVFLCARFSMEDTAIDTVDKQLGRMMAVLSAHGQTNTVIIFTALSGEPGLDDLPLLESRIRIPMIISGVRGQDRGTTSDQFVSLADLVPTIRSLAETGADIRECDEDLVPLVRGDIVGSLRAGAVCELEDKRLAVRSDRYLLLGTAEGTVTALHQILDEKVDPNNLVGDPKHIRMQVALTKVLSRALAG